MIIWITGNTGAGKTTLANTLKNVIKNSIVLDGNDMRDVWQDLGMSKKDREENNMRIARLAKNLESQGNNIIVAVIAPYEELRERIKKITNCKFIYIPHDTKRDDAPYEIPKNPDFIYNWK